ncbi:hypothetical protein E2C01_078793 [Portunus trituberculatus]|uniref:Uncharacterized protein n=1 Tax=Portunus trituberculatus TaxID=210409 RepID=A0A5B7IR58_PORTR|nr:hypothetical protein [Portunus trituberculatus]
MLGEILRGLKNNSNNTTTINNTNKNPQTTTTPQPDLSHTAAWAGPPHSSALPKSLQRVG